MATKAKAKGTPKRTGRRAKKYADYFAERAIPRKLRQIVRRNGVRAAREWAMKQPGALAPLEALLQQIGPFRSKRP